LWKEELPKISEDKVRAIILSPLAWRGWPKFLRPLVILARTIYLGRFCDLIYCLDVRLSRPARLAAKLLRRPYWLRAGAEGLWMNEVARDRALTEMSRADRVVVWNLQTKNDLTAEKISAEKIAYSQLPVILPEDLPSREELRRKWRIEGPVAISGGRLSGLKNMLWLIELWPLVLKSVPEAKILITGTGSQVEKLTERIKTLGLEGQILLTGLLPRAEYLRYLRLADLYLEPCLRGGADLGRREAEAVGTNTVTGAEFEFNAAAMSRAIAARWNKTIHPVDWRGESEAIITEFIRALAQATAGRSTLVEKTEAVLR
jgi:glycosyltransferase involved in cell wall biosynthesis